MSELSQLIGSPFGRMVQRLKRVIAPPHREPTERAVLDALMRLPLLGPKADAWKEQMTAAVRDSDFPRIAALVTHKLVREEVAAAARHVLRHLPSPEDDVSSMRSWMDLFQRTVETYHRAATTVGLEVTELLGFDRCLAVLDTTRSRMSIDLERIARCQGPLSLSERYFTRGFPETLPISESHLLDRALRVLASTLHDLPLSDQVIETAENLARAEDPFKLLEDLFAIVNPMKELESSPLRSFLARLMHAHMATGEGFEVIQRLVRRGLEQPDQSS